MNNEPAVDLTPQMKEQINPLYRPRFKQHSVDSANKIHIPRLTHKNANFK